MLVINHVNSSRVHVWLHKNQDSAQGVSFSSLEIRTFWQKKVGLNSLIHSAMFAGHLLCAMYYVCTAFVLIRLPIWYLGSLPIKCSKTLFTSCHYSFWRKIAPIRTDVKNLQWSLNISSLRYFSCKNKSIVAKLKWDGPPPHPNFGSDVKIAKAIYAPRGGRSRVQQVWKWSEGIKRNNWHWLLLWLEVGAIRSL